MIQIQFVFEYCIFGCKSVFRNNYIGKYSPYIQGRRLREEIGKPVLSYFFNQQTEDLLFWSEVVYSTSLRNVGELNQTA
jgi:hypothetical protein